MAEKILRVECTVVNMPSWDEVMTYGDLKAEVRVLMHIGHDQQSIRIMRHRIRHLIEDQGYAVDARRLEGQNVYGDYGDLMSTRWGNSAEAA